MSTLYHWLWYLLPANPIMVRVIQGGSNRLRHFWVRIGYLGALILLVLIGLMSGGGLGGEVSMTELAKSGAQVFTIVSYGQVGLICLLAPLFMAGAINEEQAGETFDILLTTPLSNLQIVLGSLLGRLFFVLSLLASGLPLFAVLLIFGGVPIKSVFVAFAVAGLAACLVGSVAITLAVLRKGGRKAVFVFIIAITAYLVASYSVDLLIRLARSVGTPPPAPIVSTDGDAPGGIGTQEGTIPTDEDGEEIATAQSIATGGQTTWITPLHPILVLEASINTANYRPPTPEDVAAYPAPIRFYLSQPLGAFASMSGIISLGLVLWSAIRLRAIGSGENMFMNWARKKFNLPALGGEKRRPPRRVWSNPVAWREANARGRGVWAILSRWSFAFVCISLGALLLLAYHMTATGAGQWLPDIRQAPNAPSDPAWVFRSALLTLLLVELAVIVMVAIYMSAGAVSREREDGTLDLMLTTPITPRKYVWGKLQGLVRFLTLLLAAPIITVAMVATYSLIGNMLGKSWATAQYSWVQQGGVGTGTQALMIPEAAILLPIILVPFVAMCATVGMNWSIKAKGIMGAVVPTILIIGVLMLIMGFCGYNAAEHIGVIGPFINSFSPTTSIVMLLNPWESLQGFAQNEGPSRVALFIAAFFAAGGYGLIVFLLLQMMVKGFDQTVRKLSGTA